MRCPLVAKGIGRVGVQKGWGGALQRSGVGASALAASLERDARKGEGTWAQMEFTHRSTASSAFVSSSQFISQCFHPATSQQRDQHSPSSQGCCEDKFVNTPEARKQENVYTPDERCHEKSKCFRHQDHPSITTWQGKQGKSSAADHSLPGARGMCGQIITLTVFSVQRYRKNMLTPFLISNEAPR